nr:MAG TPA: hypothetical protein [Caudoviricetes sp.]
MLLRQSQPTTLTKETYDRQRKHSDLWKYFFQSTYCALFISRVVRILMHDRINHGMKQSAVILGRTF